jgi:UDP-glucose 4-epimerase
MIKTAVFGGCGFIGRYLVEELVKTGREVLVFDVVPYPDPTVKSLNIKGLFDSDLLVYLRYVDEIVDLVYTSNPKTSFDDPVSDILENLPVTVRLLSLATKIPNLKKFIFVSSGGTVYGDTHKKIISEDHPNNPVSPYGITKLAIEKYGLMYHHTNELPFIIVRPANAYGIGQKLNTGQGFVAHAINSIIKGNELVVFGKNGTIRDYIYVSDIASGIIATLNSGESGEAYNLGTGVGQSNIDIIEHLKVHAESCNLKVLLKFIEERKFDVKSNVLDPNKLTKVSGWKSQIDIKAGLKMTWDWMLGMQK